MNSSSINVFLLGCAFMILFTAFQSTSIIGPSVLENVDNFHVNGYVSQAIVYVFFTLTNIFAPAFVTFVGPTLAMSIASIAYFLYVLSYVSPMTWAFYIVSILVGIGGAILWTAQGVYLTENSDQTTMSRNSGIFWALFQISLLSGNIYLYVALKTDLIDRSTRIQLFTIFSVVSAIALVLFVVIAWRFRLEQRRHQFSRLRLDKPKLIEEIRLTLKNARQLLKTIDIALLLVLFAYLGLSPTFFVVVYGTSIGHYQKYGDSRKRLLGLHGLLVGVGEIVGGGLFGFITKPKTASQRGFIVVISFLVQIVYFYTVLINFPSDAPFKETTKRPSIDFSRETSEIIAFIGSFLAGLGDSGLNTQVMNILGTRYKQNAASAFSLFRCFQGLGGAIAFFYAGQLSIPWQLFLLVSILFISCLTCLYVIFNEHSTEISTFVTTPVNENGSVSYQNSSAYSFR